MFLGVDGGGTKTALCLIEHDGTFVASVQAPSSYYFSEGTGRVEAVLQQGISAICDCADITPQDIGYAFFGLPSYGDSSTDVPLLDAVPGPVLGHNRYTCDNDMMCGWAGSFAAGDGINVISGTGSMTYGENAGRRARVGGWGPLFGDEGSAYWIAIRGLEAFTRMSDGRLQGGPLQQMLREHLALAIDQDIINVVFKCWEGGRSQIAALSKVVIRAAAAGDTSAAEIVANAARQLAEIVDVTRRRLEFTPQQTVPVSYSGGVFTADSVLNAFDRELHALDACYELHEPLHPPVVGAALYAAKLAGTPLDAAALQHLRATSSTTAPNGGRF